VAARQTPSRHPESSKQEEGSDMISALLLGSLMTVINLAIQVIVIILIIQHLTARFGRGEGYDFTGRGVQVLLVVLAGLFLGHLLQFATWAVLFVWLGEFADFETAFYHSAVNFASLGYGDMVMSENWRLLGALEATNGVLMLGLSAGAVLSVMNSVLSRQKVTVEAKEGLSS
jgi:hypothetical protein